MSYIIHTFHGKHLSLRGDKFDQSNESGATETFTFERTGNDTYAIRTTTNKVLCFNNDHLELRDSIGDWERFEIKPSPKGFTIRSLAFNKLVRAQPAGHFDGADQVGDWEQFTFQVAPGTYYFRTAHGQFLTATPDGKVSQCPRTQGWERFTVASVGNNLFSIRNAHNKFLCLDNDHLETRDSVGDWERFEIKPTHDLSHFTVFVPAQNKFVRAQPGGEGAAVDAAEQAGDWERFLLQSTGSQAPAPQAAAPPQPQHHVALPAPGTYYLRTAHGQYVSSHPEGKVYQQPKCPRPINWERFTIEPVGNNLFSIRNAHNKFVCLNHDHLETRDSVGEWEQFEIKPTEDHSHFTIFAPAHRKFLRAQPGGEGAAIDGADQAGDWERFILQQA